MRMAIFAYSRRGCCTARKVISYFPETEIKAYTMERFVEQGFSPICRPTKPFYGELFNWADALIFIASCGIAVREIAPHVRDKQTDPAVIAIDELGGFVIPLLSGHIGGANAMALQIADQLKATPVITTATDINKRFSVDAWAAGNGFIIDDIRHAKMVSAAILERDIPLCSDFSIATDYPNGVFSGDSGDLGICISWQKKAPFEQTLRLIPKILHLGIGCRKGITDTAIHDAIKMVFEQNEIDMRAVKFVASIDLKAEEAGLLKYCKDNGLQLFFYSTEDLRKVQGEFTPSEFVQGITGLDNICERAALIGAEKTVVKKTALNGVTVAVAAESLEVRFD